MTDEDETNENAGSRAFTVEESMDVPGARVDFRDLRDCADRVEQIARWHYAEWAALYPSETLADFRLELEASLGSQRVPSTWVLERAGEVIGTASVVEHDMPIHRDLSPWLANVYIRPACRGTGLGRDLVCRVRDAVAADGVPLLYLFTEDAEAFYRRLGWTVRCRERYEGRAVSIMQCARGSADPGEPEPRD